MGSQLTVGDWITVGARRWPDVPCLVRGDGVGRTFAETNERVETIAAALAEAGLVPGDRVGLLATDSPEHMEVILACFKDGVVICDLNFRLRTPELANIVRCAGLKAMFVSSRYADLATEIGGDAGFQFVCRIDNDDADDNGRPSDLDALIRSTTRRWTSHAAAHGEDILSISFTSGTTGVPKGVMQSERMIRNIVLSGIREMDVRPGGFRYAGAPLFHVSGIGSILYAIAGGCGSLVLPQFDAPEVLRWMQTGGLTHCTLIPTMISALLALPYAEASDYASLRTIMYGGAPITPALLRQVIRVFGCDLYNGFGAGTEAGGQTMLFPADHQAAMDGRDYLLGSIGKPILGVDLRLCDDEMNDVAPGEIGEIVTRSETVMSGYLDQPELTAEAIVDGWFRAGDMATMDADGYLYIATRKSDMIIRGGENVYPIEIESTLADHPAVEHVAVVALPDDHWGELVGAAVVFRAGHTASAAELREHCRARLASYKVPEYIAEFAELPTNATGKLVKSAVAELVIARWELTRVPS